MTEEDSAARLVAHLKAAATSRGTAERRMNLYVRLSMATSWRARAARLVNSGSLCAVPWRHAVP